MTFAIPKPDLNLDFINMPKAALYPMLTCTRAGATATRINEKGLVEAVPANTLRLDFDPVTLKPKGVLSEIEAENLAFHSKDAGNAYWTATRLTPTSNSTDIIDPWGNNNATKCLETATTGGHRIDRANIASFPSAGQVWAAITLHPINNDWAYITFVEDGSPVKYAFFNIATGEVGFTSSGIEAHIKPRANGFYRCIAGYTTGALTTGGVHYGTATADNSASHAGNTSNGFYWIDAQVEAGPIPTSEIETTTAAVTRNKDVIQLAAYATDNFGDADATGISVLFQGKYNYEGGAAAYMYSFDDGTSSNRLEVRANQTNDSIAPAIVGGSGSIPEQTGSPLDKGQSFRFMAGYEDDNATLALDGRQLVTDTSVTFPWANLDDLNIGCSWAGGSQWNGHIEKLQIWLSRLGDAQLQYLSGGV